MVGKKLLRNHKLAITMDWLGDGSAIEERRFNTSLEEIFIFAVLFCTKSIFLHHILPENVHMFLCGEGLVFVWKCLQVVSDPV